MLLPTHSVNTMQAMARLCCFIVTSLGQEAPETDAGGRRRAGAQRVMVEVQERAEKPFWSSKRATGD